MSSLLHVVRFKDLHSWDVKSILNIDIVYNNKYKLIRLGNLLKRYKKEIDVEDGKRYRRVKIKINNNGVYLRDIEIGKNIGTKKQYLIKEGQFLVSKIDARNGAFGVATKEVDNAIITSDFLAYDIDIKVLNHNKTTLTIPIIVF